MNKTMLKLKLVQLVTLRHKPIPKFPNFPFDCESSLLIDFNKTHWGCRTYNLDDIITKFHPVGVVLGLDNTDGVIIPRLGHLAHSDYGLLLWVILQDVIRKIRFTLTATCNFSLKYSCLTNCTKSMIYDVLIELILSFILLSTLVHLDFLCVWTSVWYDSEIFLILFELICTPSCLKVIVWWMGGGLVAQCILVLAPVFLGLIGFLSSSGSLLIVKTWDLRLGLYCIWLKYPSTMHPPDNFFGQ